MTLFPMFHYAFSCLQTWSSPAVAWNLRTPIVHNSGAAQRTCGFGTAFGDTMAKKTEAREIIRIVCTEDGKNYYTTTKNKRNTTERLELKKYNPSLRKHTLHREKK